MKSLQENQLLVCHLELQPDRIQKGLHKHYRLVKVQPLVSRNTEFYVRYIFGGKSPRSFWQPQTLPYAKRVRVELHAA